MGLISRVSSRTYRRNLNKKMSFIGAVVVGQPAVLNFQNNGDKWLAQLPFIKQVPINQIVNITCFLTQVLPDENLGAEIFVNIGDDWNSIGYLSNDKPSTVLNVKITDERNLNGLTIGVQAKELTTLKHTFPDESVQDRVVRAEKVATKVVNHLQNFAHSFVITANDIGNHIQNGNITMQEEFVPLKSFGKWMNSLTRRLQNDPDFQ